MYLFDLCSFFLILCCFVRAPSLFLFLVFGLLLGLFLLVIALLVLYSFVLLHQLLAYLLRIGVAPRLSSLCSLICVALLLVALLQGGKGVLPMLHHGFDLLNLPVVLKALGKMIAGKQLV